MAEKVCVVENLSYYYKNIFLGKQEQQKKNGISNISFELQAGEIRGLVGESGSGKSTLAKCIAGLLPVQEGTVKTKNVGMIFQDSYSALNPAKTVGWLLEETLKLKGIKNRLERKQRIKTILDETELDEQLLDRFPSALSGGQRQRVMIAIALLSDPLVLIADEPVAALDVTIQKQILNLLHRLCKERALAVLFISHDLRCVYQICDTCMVMKDGKLVEDGTVNKVYYEPENDYTKLLLKSAGI